MRTALGAAICGPDGSAAAEIGAGAGVSDPAVVSEESVPGAETGADTGMGTGWEASAGSRNICVKMWIRQVQNSRKRSRRAFRNFIIFLKDIFLILYGYF
jgi:hypothetical protein